MTTLRRLAIWTSEVVVRLASPGAKEWAQATARELDAIPNDWASLRWALGSTRILLQDSEAPLESPAEVPMAAAMLAGQIRQRTWIICPIVLFEAVCFAGFFPPMHSPMQRAGCGLIIAAMAYLGWQVVARRAKKVPEGADLRTRTALYRAELEAECRFHSGWLLWSRVLAMLLAFSVFGTGDAAVHRAVAQANEVSLGVVVALLILGVFLNRRKAARYQRRIGELDRLRDW